MTLLLQLSIDKTLLNMLKINLITKYVRWLTPYGVVMWHRQKVQEKKERAFFEKKREIKEYFFNLNYAEQEQEVVEVMEYLKKYGFSLFPYQFARNYHKTDIDVFYDKSTGTRYVVHKNRRLYFPDGWSIDQVQTYYNGLSIEQDEHSPHRYETDDFTVRDGDVIADIGAAEGIWALENIEKASKAYLFECEPAWISALRKTFAPWKEKTVIVNKYVSNTSDEKFVALDHFFDGHPIHFIKADIEGMELKMLEGSKTLFQRDERLKILLSTYHQEFDAIILKEFLEQNGFTTEYSKGYMLFIYDNNLKPPYLRRGLIRAKK